VLCHRNTILFPAVLEENKIRHTIDNQNGFGFLTLFGECWVGPGGSGLINKGLRLFLGFLRLLTWRLLFMEGLGFRWEMFLVLVCVSYGFVNNVKRESRS